MKMTKREEHQRRASVTPDNDIRPEVRYRLSRNAFEEREQSAEQRDR